MTLLELCEPLFQTVCRLNRSGRKGLNPNFHDERAKINALLSDMKARAQSTPGVADQYEKVELALIFFVDSMIAESKLGFASEWNAERLAENLHPPQLGGDERFFDLLDEALADRSHGASERLQVFYTCLGLGFTGFYAGQPEYLRRKMNEISSRLKGVSESELASRICPETYEHINTADLVEPPGVRLAGWAIAVAALIVIVFAANFTLFRTTRNDLKDSLEEITRKGNPSALAGEVQP
ncbi:MAG: DotU family type IV/VI secretion system protein [Phycisphaerales bacterium]|nr:DotU family type IV/VI secretion system protein [Phycisphaerales bacterium]MCI0629498.1 DotU family type IV/VI secretion system protein [Phycisphaerales bacterium]MCI0674732.1 DotU family type IV/VI secretion system protein [Phycisphaerales bacterium]